MKHDTSNFKTVRGQRFLQLLNEESTFVELERNIIRGFPETEKRQFATDSIHTAQIGIVPYQQSGQLLVKAVMNSDGKAYDTYILFTQAEFPQQNDEEEGEEEEEQQQQQGNPVDFRGADNNDYQVYPISLSQVNVKVRCNCLDFYYRFSTWNYNDGSLFGDKPPSYTRKTNTHPPVNPMHVPGVCKHVLKMVEEISNTGIITR